MCYARGIVHTFLPCIVPAPGEPWVASHALNIPVVLATCLATGVGAAAGIMGLKFALHGSGAELVHAVRVLYSVMKYLCIHCTSVP